MNIKLIIALVMVAVLVVTVVGFVSAQIPGATPNGTANGATSNSFFGWVGRCFGYRGTSQYGTQAPAYNQPENITVINPYTNTTATYQGYYGFGRCGMMGSFP